MLHEPFLARASEPGAEHGRHALGAFLTLRLADRFRPAEEAPHPLALAYQVRATQDYLEDLHPQAAEVAHLMEIVRLAGAVQKGGVRSMLEPPLLAYAHWLEEELRLAEALDVVETALGLNDGTSRTEEIAALLQRGRVLRLLGQFDDARKSYAEALRHASRVGDTHSALLSRIGDAIVMKQLGNLKGSERALRAILQEAERAGDVDAQARACHDLGAVLVHLEHLREAIVCLYRAFELYERKAHKLRALADLGEGLRREGRLSAARDAFTLILKSRGTEELRISAMIALLEVSAQIGDRVGFAKWKRDVAALAEDLPPERQALFQLQLGIGLAAFGQRRSAEGALRAALTIAERHHLNEYTFRVEAAIKDLRHAPAPNMPETQAMSGAEESRDYAEIATRLHALAS